MNEEIFPTTGFEPKSNYLNQLNKIATSEQNRNNNNRSSNSNSESSINMDTVEHRNSGMNNLLLNNATNSNINAMNSNNSAMNSNSTNSNSGKDSISNKNSSLENGVNRYSKDDNVDDNDDDDCDDDDDVRSKNSSSTDAMTGEIDPNHIEDRFRVDRRKLEQLILAIGNESEKLNAEDLFNQVMRETNTTIAWPSKLKIGARSKKEFGLRQYNHSAEDLLIRSENGTNTNFINKLTEYPFVKVFGTREAIAAAKEKVLSVLDTKSHRVTLKMEVSHTDHSHIIGKGGINIKQVMQDTDCHIHFPDSNRGATIDKCNQVSIAGSAAAVEKARTSIRDLQPLVILFEVPFTLPSCTIPESCAGAMQQIEQQYNVKVTMRQYRQLGARSVLVRGSVHAAQAVKQATAALFHLLVGLNDMSLATVSLLVDIAPIHHALVVGPSGTNIRQVMQHTDTTVHFPDVASVAPNRRNTIYITGAIENVMTAREQLLGCLPLVMLYDIQEDTIVDLKSIGHLMDRLAISISIKPKQKPPNKSVVMKGSERQVGSMYEARRIIAAGNYSNGIKENLTSGVTGEQPVSASQIYSTSGYHQSVGFGRLLMVQQGAIPSLYPSGSIVPVSITQVPVYQSTPHVNNIPARPTAYHFSPGSHEIALTKASSFNGPFQGVKSGVKTPSPPGSLFPCGHQTATTESLSNNSLNSVSASDIEAIYDILRKAEEQSSVNNKKISSPMSDPNLILPNLQSHNFNLDSLLGYHSQMPTTNGDLFRNEKSPVDQAMAMFSIASLSDQQTSLGLEAQNIEAKLSSSFDRQSEHMSPLSIPRSERSPASSLSHSPSAMGGHPLGQLGISSHDVQESDMARFSSPVCEGLDRNSPQQSKAPGFSRPRRAENSFFMSSGSLLDFEYEQKKLLANRAIQDKPSGEMRIPTDFWSGLGFSRSTPSTVLRSRLGAHPLRPQRSGLTVGQGQGEECGAIGGLVEQNIETTFEEGGEADSQGSMWSGESANDPSRDPNMLPSTEYVSDESFAQLLNVMSGATVPNFLENTASEQEGNKASIDAFSRLSSIWRPICPVVPPGGDSDTVTPALNQDVDLPTLLSQLGLSRYTDVFLQQEIDLPTFRSLSEQDLKELGISTFGARRKMLLAIADLNKKQSMLAPPPGLPNPYGEGNFGGRLDFFSHSGRF